MATIEPSTFVLKDGREAILRTATIEDAEAFQKHVGIIVDNGAGMTALPSEIKPKSQSPEKLGKLIEHENQILLLAFLDEQLIGNLDFHVGKRKRLAHTGGFGMSVHPDFRGLGVGNALLARMIDWAKANPRLERIELNVLASNEPAIGLYRKLGFVEEGRKVDAIKYQDGTYVDDLQMVRFWR